MKPDAIQQRALKTWYEAGHPLRLDPLPAVLGLAGEAGEVADQYKKHLFKPGNELTPDAALDELGDVLYYVAIRAYQLGVTLDDLSRANAEKLADGHGYGEVRKTKG